MAPELPVDSFAQGAAVPHPGFQHRFRLPPAPLSRTYPSIRSLRIHGESDVIGLAARLPLLDSRRECGSQILMLETRAHRCRPLALVCGGDVFLLRAARLFLLCVCVLNFYTPSHSWLGNVADAPALQTPDLSERRPTAKTNTSREISRSLRPSLKCADAPGNEFVGG